MYKYLLRRRPDQGELATSRVEFGGKSAPKGMSALTRNGVFDVDLSCGRESPPVSPVCVITGLCFGKEKKRNVTTLGVMTTASRPEGSPRLLY